MPRQASVLEPRDQARIYRALKATPRDLAIWALTTYAGLRAGEVAALKWRQVLDSSGLIRDHVSIERAGTKTPAGVRKVDLIPELQAILTRWRSETPYPSPDDPIAVRTSGHKARLGTALTANAIEGMLGKLYRDLGLVGCSSHSGRATWATAQLEKGVSPSHVQRQGGWKSLAGLSPYWRSSPAAREQAASVTSAALREAMGLSS